MSADPDLRELLPDVARAGDAQCLLNALRNLSIRARYSNGTIRVALHNGFELVLLPAVPAADGLPAWATTTHRVSQKPRNGFEAAFLAMQKKAGIPTDGIFTLYCVFATLEGEATATMPAAHWRVESADPIDLCDQALTWARHHTALPLQYQRQHVRRSRPCE